MELLAKIEDTSNSERTYVEHPPWILLMRKTYNLGPWLHVPGRPAKGTKSR